MKHTKGPWKVITLNFGPSRDNPDTKYVVIDTEQNKVISTTSAINEEFEANARLIAASPSMYDLLRQVMWLLEENPDRDHGTGYINEIKRLLNKIEEGEK